MPYKIVKSQFEQLTIEEIGNTLTHGFGLILSLVGFAILLVMATANSSFWHIASCVIYGLSLITLYAASTFYHLAISEKAKKSLQLLDHCCIYLLIAGTYTPFALVALEGTFGTTLFIVVWTFAAVGILFKIFLHEKFRAASVVSYLVMGWIGIFAVQPLFLKLGVGAIALIVAGGLVYTLGTIFYGWKSMKHHHAVWHLFVLGGSICHFLAIAIYVIPQVVNL